MLYPTLSEYKEAILLAEDNFDELKNLRPVLDEDGQPVMTSGNFAVVFKMKDEQTGMLYAVKCFTREQEGREEAYRLIDEELKKVNSPYLTSIRYLDKELFVDTSQSTETEFLVLLMDWVEGKTLDKYLRENLDDKYALEMLAYRFSQLAQWLIPQPFAHGDLKPDNILVKDDGALVLVDYDGMYVPAMKGQKARELGSPGFRHPQRTENDFDEHIDDFALVSILLSLKAISVEPVLLEQYGEKDRLLFNKNDYITGEWSNVIDKCIYYMKTFGFDYEYLMSLAIIFQGLIKYQNHIHIPLMSPPFDEDCYIAYGFKGAELLNPYIFDEQILDFNTTQTISLQMVFDSLADLDDFLKINEIDYVLSGSLGLYVHGFTLPSYIPQDIDIRIRVKSSDYIHYCDLFTKVSEYSMGKKNNIDEYSDPMFCFMIKRNKIKVNAFILHEKYSIEDQYHEYLINGCRYKVQNVLEILQEKYKMKRDKDLLFNNQMQMTMNGFFINKS